MVMRVQRNQGGTSLAHADEIEEDDGMMILRA